MSRSVRPATLEDSAANSFLCSFFLTHQPFLDHVEMLLSKFQCLVNLGISHISVMDIDLDVLDLEHDTVMRWGYIVPSLQFCTLPSGSAPPFFFWTRLQEAFF